MEPVRELLLAQVLALQVRMRLQVPQGLVVQRMDQALLQQAAVLGSGRQEVLLQLVQVLGPVLELRVR